MEIHFGEIYNRESGLYVEIAAYKKILSRYKFIRYLSRRGYFTSPSIPPGVQCILSYRVCTKNADSPSRLIYINVLNVPRRGAS